MRASVPRTSLISRSPPATVTPSRRSAARRHARSRAPRLPRRARQACASACECPHPSRSSAPSLRWRNGPRSGSPADTPQSGRCHAPFRSRRRPSDGEGRTAKAGQTHQADTRKESQPAAVREPNRRAGQHRPPGVRFPLRREAAAPSQSRWEASGRSRETCSAGGTSISGVTPTSLQRAGSVHDPWPGISKISASGLPAAWGPQSLRSALTSHSRPGGA